MVLLLFSRLTALQKETKEMALDEVGIKQLPFLLSGGGGGGAVCLVLEVRKACPPS